jgi:ubiquinone/menaquinone biosynthesis C-methylase UbiE
MDVIRNAWELEEGEGALLKLAGHSTREQFEADRQEHAKQIVQFCSITSEKRGFEVGSGDGTVARILAPQCLWLDCNDISASFLEVARTTCAQHSNISFHRIQNSYLDHLPAESYDFGFSLHVFIHFNAYDVFNYLRSVKRILKPGGVFYFDACTVGEQTIEVFREHAQMYAGSPETIRGLLNYNHPDTLRKIIQEAGLRMSDKSETSDEGWVKIVTLKPDAKRSFEAA